jgi:Arc/MetJ-type ribon-helix-helix transcriptional regulator
MSNSHTKAGKVEAVTIAIPPELRAQLDVESVRRTVERGRPVSRSAVARDLLERALELQRREPAA